VAEHVAWARENTAKYREWLLLELAILDSGKLRWAEGCTEIVDFAAPEVSLRCPDARKK